MEKTRKLQIGVMGSAQDLNYGKKLEELAEEVGLLDSQRRSNIGFWRRKRL